MMLCKFQFSDLIKVPLQKPPQIDSTLGTKHLVDPPSRSFFFQYFILFCLSAAACSISKSFIAFSMASFIRSRLLGWFDSMFKEQTDFSQIEIVSPIEQSKN